MSIDQKKWEMEVKNQVSYCCVECDHETPFNEVTLEPVKNGLVLQVLSNESESEVWECSNCKHINPIETTRIKRIRREEPFYLKVVPPCPVRNQGVQNRLGFNQRFSKWFYKYLEELEYQLGLYRLEYANEGDEENVYEPKDDE